MSTKKRRQAVSPSQNKPLPADRPRRGGDAVLWGILAVAFVVRLGVLLQLHDHPLLRPSPQLDTGVYLDLARRVAGGDLLAGDRVFFVSPFYIYFAAFGLFLSGGSVLGVQLLQVALGTAAVWLVADSARAWFGRRGAWVAGGLAALTGYFAFNESLLLQSAVDPFLTALGLWALARAWRVKQVLGPAEPSPVEPTFGPALRRYLLAGLALGLHSLNRPNILAWAAAALLLTLAVEGWRRKRAWMSAAALAGGLAVAVAPVAVRNYAVGGQLALVSSHGGLNFYIGNNPRADGTYRMVEGITPSISGQDRDMRRVAENAVGHPVSDVEASSWFYDEAWRWIETHPGAAAGLFACKIAYVFNHEDIPLNDSYTYYATDESLLLRALVVGPWLLLPLGLAGIWLARRTKAEGGGRGGLGSGFSRIWGAWISFVPVYALSVAIFFVTGRYRLPLLVPLCVTSAGAALALLDAYARRRAEGGRREAIVAVVLVAVLAVATNWNLGLDNGLAGWRAEMVLADIQAGRDQDAKDLLARTEPIYPNRGLLLYRVGRAYLARGQASEALSVFERGLKVDPDRGELRVAIGETLLQMGRAGEAISWLEEARRTAVVEDRASLALARAQVMTGRVGEGLATLRAVRAPERLDPGAQLAAGQMALENGDGATAEPFLERAVRMAPGNVEAREAYGLALAMQGRRQEAAAMLEQACRLDPGSASSRLNLAILYGEMGRVADARQAAEDALRLRPDYTRAREFLTALGR